MNVSALRQTSAHWDEIVEALGFVRTAYAEARGGYGPDILDLWRVSQLGSALPWFFVLAGDAATRDRLVVTSPRALFAQLAARL